MKTNFARIIAVFGLFIAAFSLQGCITEECEREGLTVYTNWPDAPENWMSVCDGGYWIDAPLTIDGVHSSVFSKFPNCRTVGCYKNGVDDCECLETYPFSQRKTDD